VGSAGTLVDTGLLYAAADDDDDDHDACVAVLAAVPGPLVVPVLVVAEVAYFVAKRLGAKAEARFVSRVGEGELVPEHVHPADWLPIAELVWRYHDLPLGTVDASIVAAAERLGITRVVTLDRRHFGVVRPRHVDLFDVLPD